VYLVVTVSPSAWGRRACKVPNPPLLGAPPGGLRVGQQPLLVSGSLAQLVKVVPYPRHAKRIRHRACRGPIRVLRSCPVAGARHLEDVRDGLPRRDSSHRLADQRAQPPGALPLNLRHPRSGPAAAPDPDGTGQRAWANRQQGRRGRPDDRGL
jgi:hypothetical protein